VRLYFIAASLLAAATLADAQTLAISCADAAGRPVRPVPRTNGIIAKAAVDADGRRVIESDSRQIDGVAAQQHLFVYAHECAHHALGHDVSQPFTATEEQSADCQAVQMLMRRAGVTSNDIMLLQTKFRDLPPDAARRLPWRSRMYDLEGCLPDVVARRQAASRPSDVGANECIVHNDAENAIVGVSRDRLTIDSVYEVGNRCTRAVLCAFTIQVGTLPDADADAGSWRNFHVQTTIVEEHEVPANVTKTEHRFRSSVDRIPPGESVNFRVVPACW